MKRLNRIVLINAAGFGYLDFPVGGHGQVIGVNGHGKTTLLRSVLFFYLGTNDKAPFGLDETKADFVSHYLGEQPSYLIYEVERGDGEPAYHVAVTRPAGRIQFHFVDAPFRKDYYLDGRFVQPMERVAERWREARCASEQVTSYDDFHHRLYGIVPSPYSVFRPAPRSSGQVGILPRIISGIFTVSQLDADKLKSALTCGVRKESLATELDLSLLKNHLENFRRVNRAVKTYLSHEEDALTLVDVAETFASIVQERHRSIEDLVSMAKRLPEKSEEIIQRQATLERERAAADDQFKSELQALETTIVRLGKEIAVLEGKVTKGESTLGEYERLEIARKGAEIQKLPQLREEKRFADAEYASITAKFEDERQRKERMLAEIQQTWTELSRQSEQRKAECERDLRKNVEALDQERTAALASIVGEESQSRQALIPRRQRSETARVSLNNDFKALSEFREPSEFSQAKAAFAAKEQKQREESNRQDRLRAQIALEKANSERERERLERDAQTEGERIQTIITQLETQRDRVVGELEKFDESLARYFQTEAPSAWPAAARTLNRETLFKNADELTAKKSTAPEASAWGVEFSTENLPEPVESYNRDALSINLQEIRKALNHQHDQLEAARARYIAASGELDKRTAQARTQLEAEIDTSVRSRSALLEEIVHLENRVLTLGSQIESAKRDRRTKLEKREIDVKKEEERLREEEDSLEKVFGTRRHKAEEDFGARRKQLSDDAHVCLSSIGDSEAAAKRKRDGEVARIEEVFQLNLTQKGVDPALIQAARQRATATEDETHRIEAYQNEVTEYQQLRREYIDPLPSLRSQLRASRESFEAAEISHKGLRTRHDEAIHALDARAVELAKETSDLKEDEGAVKRFQRDSRFMQEWGYFDRDDIAAAPFYRAGAVRDSASAAENAHERRLETGRKGDKDARTFLNRFDPETLDRKVLGFSPLHAHFDWFIFVGSELRPFVNGRGIQAMKKIQTQEFEQLIRNICAKNADFREGIRQVKQTAALVQQSLEENNFVDVLDSIELKVERVDNKLTEILGKLEDFADVSFTSDRDLFGKQADRAQIDRAIETFERLLREIDSYREKRLLLTDYFDFNIRVHENGHDLGWRKSLDHIGSTGTDYLVKMLIYLSLIEVYRERALEAKTGSTVHCVLDETGVLAPKYIRSVLDYATKRGIILITAGHSQQTLGFENWIRVCKQGQKFAGQTVLRKVLKCD